VILKQLSVLIENKKGSLAEVTGILKESHIDLRAIAAFDTPDFGILRLVVDKPEIALKKLLDKDYNVVITDVIAIDLEDKVGVLNDILSILEEGDIAVEYIYSFVLGNNNHSPLIIFKVDKINEAISILESNKVKVVLRNKIQSI
jgi:hypothetical protein